MSELEPGESIGLGMTAEGGPTIRRDPNVEDAYQIDGHGGELYRDEIKRIAELAGLTVVEGDE